MKPLLFVGNRRSGTSMFTMILNEHHDLFVSLEADALWHIYTSGSLTVAPDDAAVHPDWFQSRRITNVDAYLPWSELTGTPQERFFQDITHIRQNGVYGIQDAYPEKRDLVYLGEKKPGVTTEPELRPWLDAEFPEARFLHLVRNPLHSIGSMARLNWAEGDIEYLTQYWVRLEDQAAKFDSLLVRFEDLTTDPFGELARIAEYLGLDPKAANNNADSLGRMVTKRGTIMPEYSDTTDQWIEQVVLTDELKRYIDEYGY